MKEETIKINEREYIFKDGETVLQVARRNGIIIPTLCEHPDLKVKANCRVCVVEITDQKGLPTSCSTKAEDGMEVFTNTERVARSRRLNLELIFAEHIEKCATCIWRFECKLLKYAKDYGLLVNSFKDRKGKRKIYKMANAVELDSSQCIDCRNCVDACALQGINYLEVKGKGIKQEIVLTKDKDKHCILCGQCAVHCPVSAAQEQASWQKVEAEIKNPKKIVVAQFAPSIRVSIGEDFGMPHGSIATENLAAGLKALDFDYVFDVSFAADITTIVEAEELLKRLKYKESLPLITSCCPAWVNYVEFYHPELIPNLTTARSPQIHGGGAIKTYWANKMNVDPRDIVVVSIMPCTAKKYEASRAEMKIEGKYFPVDYVLTTRELSFMLKKSQIDFVNIKKQKCDNPLGEYSGAGVIFGGSGGVMEAALRSAEHKICKNGKECSLKLDFHEVRGMEDFKEADIQIGDAKLKVGVVNGIGNIEKVINRLDEFHYIEVMACPGGCIGGGGQPIPTTKEIVKKRVEALYSDDKMQKARMSYHNKGATKIIDWIGKNNLDHETLHTHYKKKTKY